MKKAKPLAITFCVQCGSPGTEKGRNGRLKPNPANQALALQVKALLERDHPETAACLAVRLSRCQGACEHPCGWQLMGQGREGLQWGGGSPELAADIALCASQYAALPPHQKLTKATYPGNLRGKLLARLFPWPKPQGYR